jgi:hypothetical protein
MVISELAIIGAGRIGRAALSSYGWQLGKGTYRKTGDIFFVVAAAVLGGAGSILPFMAGRQLTQWHSQGRLWFIIHVLMKWPILAATGAGVLFCMLYLIGDVMHPTNGKIDLTLREAFPFAIKWTKAIIFSLYGLGVLKGLTERRRRKSGFRVVADNQKFLDSLGFREMDGKNVTHVDGAGNRLRLDHVGRDIVEFDSALGYGKAFILVGPDGRYLNYSGLIND